MIQQILLIDPDPRTAEQSIGVISQSGQIVDYVGSDAEAAHAVSQINYDLVLLDIHLPLAKGLTCLENIASSKGPLNSRDTPIMILSNIDDPELIKSCYQKGACNFITKPLTTNKLQAALSLLAFRQHRHMQNKSTDKASNM